MRIVRTKSIPNVSDDRLLSDLMVLHRRLHTAEGLSDFSDPRRSLVENGMKAKRIAAELRRRGHTINCALCASPLDEANLPTRYRR